MSLRKTKECVGCGDNFLTFKNYDYCGDCAVNNNRYLTPSNCSECDGSGIIKFRQQKPRPCKLCYLTKKSMKKLNNGRCISSEIQRQIDAAKKKYPCIKTINYCCGCCQFPESAQECCWENYQKVDLSKILNPFGRLQGGLCCACLWWEYPNEHDCEYLKNERGYFSSCCWTTEGQKYQREKKRWSKILK